MNFDEIKKYLEDNKDSEEVKNFIGGLLTTDRMTNFLTTSEEGKKLLQREKDSHFNKSLETWKANNLGKIIDDEIAKRYPPETEEQKKLRQLQADLENEKRTRTRSELKTKVIGSLTEKGLPIALADYILGEDEDMTNANVEKIVSIWEPALTKAVETKFAANGREPQKQPDIPSSYREDMSMAEYVAMREKEGIK